MNHYILAIDQGTTSTRACIYDKDQSLVAWSQQEFEQFFPQIGRVEHNPQDIWQSTLSVCHSALAQANIKASQVIGLGISNQRETTIMWHKQTGEAVSPAIVWQDRRTHEYCQGLKDAGFDEVIQRKTGLLIDPYFSASKIRWILDHIPRAQALVDQGLLAFGTVESYLVWQLTGGKRHVTDVSNASRTLLMNIHNFDWDDELLAIFGIPRSILPTIVDNSGHVGDTLPALFGAAIPITGLAGDQQAAMVGQACIQPNSLKATVGTGAFLMLNTGQQVIQSQCRLISTVAYKIGNDYAYALEGSIFNTGTAVKWLRDQMGLIQAATDTERLARSLMSNDGFYLVPSFTGLGAPYWQPEARALCYGITRATTPAHFARGALEAVAYQLLDIKHLMEQDAALTIHDIRLDGGLTANHWFLQFLADMLNVPLLLSPVAEASCYGAGLLAAIGAGQFANLQQASTHWHASRKILPTMAAALRLQNYQGWSQALGMLTHKPD